MKSSQWLGCILAAGLCLSAWQELGAAQGGGGGGGKGAGGGRGQGKNSGPKFKDVGVNTAFYFASDNAKAYRWVKVSATTASNTVNNAVAEISVDTQIKY